MKLKFGVQWQFMMLIPIMVLTFQPTDKSNQILRRHHFQDNENMELPIPW